MRRVKKGLFLFLSRMYYVFFFFWDMCMTPLTYLVVLSQQKFSILRCSGQASSHLLYLIRCLKTWYHVIFPHSTSNPANVTTTIKSHYYILQHCHNKIYWTKANCKRSRKYWTSQETISSSTSWYIHIATGKLFSTLVQGVPKKLNAALNAGYKSTFFKHLS